MVTDEEAQRRVVRAEFVTRFFLIFVAVVCTASLVLIAVVTLQNSHRGKENRETLGTIRDCTQTTGECYRRGQESLAQTVASLNLSGQQAASAAAACALTVQHPTYRAIYRCVQQTASK